MFYIDNCRKYLSYNTYSGIIIYKYYTVYVNTLKSKGEVDRVRECANVRLSEQHRVICILFYYAVFKIKEFNKKIISCKCVVNSTGNFRLNLLAALSLLILTKHKDKKNQLPVVATF